MSIIELIQNRRSIYDLGKIFPTGEIDVNALVKECVTWCPSAFNSQTSKAVVLYGENHQKLWNLLKEKMRLVAKGSALIEVLVKIDGFINAHGTILFYENQETIKAMEDHFPIYAHNFQNWSQQSSGMLQFAIWTGLREIGLGANIQHYNELIEEDLYPLFNIDRKYKLISQMPFGDIKELPGEKKLTDIEERFAVLQ